MTASPATPAELPSRDEAILLDLARVRLLTGRQLERLHFADVSTQLSRSSARRRSLTRLQSQQLVTTLPRRVGGERAGSAGLVYTLDSAGQRHLNQLADTEQRIRRPWQIGSLFVAHTLDVAELYVRLIEQQRAGALALHRFEAEPASWHRAGYQLLKPDAYAVWTTPDWEQHRWLEVDRATESLPTLRRKLLTYTEAAISGDQGPAGVWPLVVVTVPNLKRLTAVQRIIAELPTPAEQFISTELFVDTFREDDNVP